MYAERLCQGDDADAMAISVVNIANAYLQNAS